MDSLNNQGLINLSADWLIGWQTDCLADWRTNWMGNWQIYCLSDGLNNWRTVWLIYWMADCLTDCYTFWLDWLIDGLLYRQSDVGLTDWQAHRLTDTDWLTIGLSQHLSGSESCKTLEQIPHGINKRFSFN